MILIAAAVITIITIIVIFACLKSIGITININRLNVKDINKKL